MHPTETHTLITAMNFSVKDQHDFSDSSFGDLLCCSASLSPTEATRHCNQLRLIKRKGNSYEVGVLITYVKGQWNPDTVSKLQRFFGKKREGGERELAPLVPGQTETIQPGKGGVPELL